MSHQQAPVSSRRDGDRRHAKTLVIEFRDDPTIREIDHAHDRVEKVAFWWVADRCHTIVGVHQLGVLRGAVHDPTAATS